VKAALDCSILIVRDGDGYTCGRLGSEICSDCGTPLCDIHSDCCEVCEQVFCDCCLYFHLKERHVRKAPPVRVPVPERRSA
jgi:predicted sulfurtransferase